MTFVFLVKYQHSSKTEPNYNKGLKKPLSQIRFNLNSDNGFCFIRFPVAVVDVDIMVEMGRSG